MISTAISDRSRDIKDPHTFVEKTYNLFFNYQELMSKDHPSANRFNMTLDSLDQTIGYFKELRFRTFLGFFNPLKVIASILKMPISILEYMGFDIRGNIGEKLLTIIIQAIWIVFLTILSLRFGEQSELLRTIIENLK